MFQAPESVSTASAWVEHIPFAFWLVEALAPRTVVELGTHVGTSYFAFCQAVAGLKLQTRCYAVDTWQGDEHAMFYGEEVYQAVAQHNARYSAFSTLLRTTFDAGRAQFPTGSVDLLHIDGLHTYGAVKHDLETWLDAVSDRGVVLFHDTAERERGFGVHRLWEDVAVRYPHFEFLHGHGLGVLGIGKSLPSGLHHLFAAADDDGARERVRAIFARLGGAITSELSIVAEQARAQSVHAMLAELTRHYEVASNEGRALREDLRGYFELSERLRRNLTDARQTGAAALRRAAAAEAEAVALQAQAQTLEARAEDTASRLTQEIRVLNARAMAPRWLAQQTFRAAKARLASIASRLPGIGARVGAGVAVQRELTESGLFDRDCYLSRYPDVAASGMDPLEHYLRRGGYEGRDPNPFFSSAWYLQHNPDVSAARINPLLHYLRIGGREGRDPHPEFSGRRYLAANPDIAEAGENPLAHYLAHGISEGRPGGVQRSQPRLQKATGPSFLSVVRTRPLGDAWKEMGSEDTRSSVAPMERKIDVIVPVYRGVAETRRCIDSVLGFRAQNQTFGRLVVVDDCGPEPEMRVYMDELARRSDLTMLRNERNRGFVRSVNRGMRDAGGNDVVLLNSDAEVHGDWLDRIARQADADPRIATVTPFSNNATICSFPEMGDDGELLDGVDLATIDSVFARANAGRSIEIPTGVGFCMFIRRSALRELGLFDEGAFGRGYGEENDFCMRARDAGWRNVLAGDVFVYHEGEVSFADGSAAGKKRATEVITRRYPGYEATIAEWIGRDPAFPMRFAAEAGLVRASAQNVHLHVLHAFGGGTERHVAETANVEDATTAHLVLLQRKDGEQLHLSLLTRGRSGWDRTEFVVGRLTEAAPLIAAFGVTRVHIHHCVGIEDDLPAFLQRLGAPYDLTIHDYALVCPRTFMVRQGRYCGEPDPAGCLTCLAEDPPTDAGDIFWWRQRGVDLLARADRVLCPTADVATRVTRYAPSAAVELEPHEHDLYRAPSDLRPARAGGRKLRVAVIGVMAEHKGGHFLLDCVERASEIGAEIEWRVIGDFPPMLSLRARRFGAVLSVTGAYADGEAVAWIEDSDPDMIFFPQRCPETYSYTLSEAFAARRAVLAPRLGAFIERVEGQAACWLYDADATPDAVVDLIVRVAAGEVETTV